MDERSLNLLVFNLRMDADDSVLGFTHEWVNELARYCDRVVVVTMSAGRVEVASNVQVLSVGRERGFSEARRSIEFYRLLSAVLSNMRIDACLAHMMPLFAVMAWPLLRLRRVRTVLWYAHGHISLMVRIAERLVDSIITSSRSGFPMRSDKVNIIGQGIDVDRFRPNTNSNELGSEFVILTVGRVARVKRLDLLLHALRILPPVLIDGRTIKARIIGEPLSAKDREAARGLVKLAKRLGVDDRVEFLEAEPHRQVHSRYQEADVFVNSSETHSMDKTVLEAMSSGVIVVTSNVAFRDILKNDAGARYLVPPNDPRALADAIAVVAAMPLSERVGHGKRLREIVVNGHSIQALCKRVIGHLDVAKPANSTNRAGLGRH